MGNVGFSMGMSFLWEFHGNRPMGWDRHKLLWDGNGTDKYVPWTTLTISMVLHYKISEYKNMLWSLWTIYNFFAETFKAKTNILF